jgi:CheY-like chemotaxis protein
MRIIDSRLRFEINIDSNIPNALFGDEIRIRQMLLNILSNAVKYTKKGFISFTVNGKIIDDTVFLDIEVTDSGIGIKKEDLEKLFDDFVRLDFAANRGVEGTGLGLTITKNLVKAMGGDINVYSEYGRGSTFTIKLPQKINSHKPLGTIKTLEERSGDNIIVKFNAPKARVLIVDDISTNLKVAEGLMLPYKMQIDLCQSGTEAIEAVSKNRYDLVFMDHMMPEMNGIEATKLIREMGNENPHYVNLPIVALTANAVSGAKEMFLSNDFNDFLSKPIDIIKLNTILGKWLPKEKQEKINEKAKVTDAGDDDSEIMKIEIEGIDIRKGISMTGGKFKSYLQTLAVFHKDGIQKIEEIKECLKTDNYSLYATYAHALKSALTSIGASELSENARALEMAGKQENAAFISSNNAQFLKNLETLLDNLGNALSTGGKGEQKNPVDFKFLRNELNILKEALKVFNSVAIDKATNNLQKFVQADDIGTKVQNILQNILIGEYDDAVVMIDSLILLL